ncbi:hypothetical protein [Streptomyces sp. NBC_01497]|uniref:hypothetical protein n=1 Tax=Streptomyces sp. NBC_01497 TaxID=2903885 RepID=UPI002E35BF0F|nr:hypothetical protein [Streptomyces sp. NBC_01497]
MAGDAEQSGRSDGAEPPPWDGVGLPPAARERMAGAQRSGTWTSALSTGAFAAVRSVGFEPVGQVMGSAVYQIWNVYDCQYSGYDMLNRGAPSRTVVYGMEGYDAARRTALERLTTECAMLGGDGVVAAELTVAPFPTDPSYLEFKVIGTAVRARGPVRPKRPFTCHLDGQGFAKLVSNGWVPVELLVGMGRGVTHDTFLTNVQSSSWSNAEVDGWSSLVQAARASSRRRLAQMARSRGSDGVILATGSLVVREAACWRVPDQRDHIADSTMIGTSVAAFRRSTTKPSTLAVLPLGRHSDRLRARLAAVESSPYGDPLERSRLVEELHDLGEQG